MPFISGRAARRPSSVARKHRPSSDTQWFASMFSIGADAAGGSTAHSNYDPITWQICSTRGGWLARNTHMKMASSNTVIDQSQAGGPAETRSFATAVMLIT